MTFDLAVWKSDRQLSNDEATHEFASRMDALKSAHSAPDAVIAAFVAELVDRYPELDQPGGEHSPWAGSPLLGGASGDLVYLTMTWSDGPAVRDWVASVAQRHGLLCYDPQDGAVIRVAA